MCNLGKNFKPGHMHSNYYLEEIDNSTNFILQKIVKRSTMSYSLHCSKETKKKVVSKIKELQIPLKYSYQSKKNS